MDKYVDFEIEIEPTTPNNYLVRVRSEAGQDRATMTLPTTNEIYTNFINSLTYNLPTNAAQEREFGRLLYDTLIQGTLREAFRAARDSAERNKETLRIKLSINPDIPELVEVAAVPWEFAVNDIRVPLATEYSFCRFLSRSQPLPKLTVTDSKLKILLTWALPKELATQFPVDVEGEVAAIKLALKPLEDAGKLTIIVEPHLTGRTLQRCIEREKPHVLHFVGHGIFEDGIGSLVLEKKDGSRDNLPVDILVDSLLTGKDSVRLVVLNACLTGTVSLNLLQGIAPALLAANIPAVVAMQSSLNDEAGVVFAEDFYANLADNKPIDLCVSRGRRAIRTGPRTRDWGLATLYMRAPDGILFEGVGDNAAASSQPAPNQPTVKQPEATPSSNANVNWGSGNNFSGGNFAVGNVVGRDLIQNNTSSPQTPTSREQDNTSVSGNLTHLTKMREILTRNLQHLESQESSFGVGLAPLYIMNQLEDTREKLLQLDAQIKQLGG